VDKLRSRIVGEGEEAPDQLLANPMNWRRHPKQQQEALEAMLRTVGWVQRVIVNRRTQHIVDGHLRVEVALRRGEPTVPVLYVDLSEAEEKVVLAAIDPIGGLAETDHGILDALLEGLQTGDDDLDAFLRSLQSEQPVLMDEGLTDEDDAPDAPVLPVSRTGDVWAIGPHRLICGDATDRTVVATLMQCDAARLCFTSPPYGNQRDYTSGGIADWDGLMRGVFGNVPMADDGQVLVNLGLIHRDNEVIPYWDAWLAWMRTQGWRRFAWYVWDQGPGMPGDWAGRFAPSFEFVFHFNRQSRKPNKIVPCKHAGQESHLRADGSSTAMRGKDGEVGGWTHKGQPTQNTRIPDSVIRVMRHKGKIGQDIDHPAVFPVALPAFAIEAYTESGDIVFDPFGGSGSTMLAAQRTGRVSRTVEIAPGYVDVAIKRFQQNHPGVPVTLLATGQSFDEVVTQRLPTTGAEQ
jgi:DNA modification methylase